MQNLQEEIDKINKGIILEIKLLNVDELYILIEDVEAIIKKFNNVIESICLNDKELSAKILRIEDSAKLYIIIEGNLALANKVANAIYNAAQKYIDQDYPESYFKFAISGIEFDGSSTKKIANLLSKLNYTSKIFRNYGNYHFHEFELINLAELRQKNIELNAFKTALYNKKLKFYYQPVINSKTNEIDYYECLLRAPDAIGNYISVGPVIQYAEVKGLINLIDQTVIEMAVEKLIEHKHLKLSVNISNIGVLNKELHHKVKALLSTHNLKGRLIIEITETTLNQDFVTTKKFIELVHFYGCEVALDDFGSGYTSFSQILELPIDIIKIDGKYVKNILLSKKHYYFVEFLANLAQKLGIKTTAEFVENEDIADMIVKMKVGSMQGNYFSEALEDPLQEFVNKDGKVFKHS